MWSSEVLTVGRSGLMLKNFLFTPPRALFWPMMRWVEITTAALLPPRIRLQFQIQFGPIERCVFYATFGLLRYFHVALFPCAKSVDRVPQYRSLLLLLLLTVCFRMIYGWLPASMRYVDRYLEMEKKQGVKRVLWPSRSDFSRLSMVFRSLENSKRQGTKEKQLHSHKFFFDTNMAPLSHLELF